MARLILRRVGITPLLSLMLASLLALVPAEPAQAHPAATAARVRVTILPQAVRVEAGRVSLTGDDGANMARRAPHGQPQQRRCPAVDAPSDPVQAQDCRMIITDMP